MIRLDLQFGKESLTFIQVYAPTDKASEPKIEQFYDSIADALHKTGKNVFILGDLKAKIGCPLEEEDLVMGKYGYGERNERGSRLIQFCLQHNFKIMNSYFKKHLKQKWTWQSQDGKTRNEIDYIIAKNHRSIQDVTVMNSNSPSDHRPIRCKLSLKGISKLSRRKIQTTNTNNLTPLEKEHLRNGFEADSELREQMTRGIMKIAQTLPPKRGKLSKLEFIFTEEINTLIKERQKLQSVTKRSFEERKN